MLEMIGWYQEQYRILRDRCDTLTARVRAAEAEVQALRQKLEAEWQAGWNAAREEME
jgi:vacuolar-type H+-ATPase subunit D/Vma8